MDTVYKFFHSASIHNMLYEEMNYKLGSSKKYAFSN